MNKLRLVLSVIVILAIVGGALAFKAKIPTQFYCYDNDTKKCDDPQTLRSTFSLSGQELDCTDNEQTVEGHCTTTFVFID